MTNNSFNTRDRLVVDDIGYTIIAWIALAVASGCRTA